nr:unnamed protein product [Callosobruchus chinensis]
MQPREGQFDSSMTRP